MKKIIALCWVMFLWACKKTSIESADSLLRQITVNGKPNHTFEYKDRQLVKENFFGFCEKNPSDEFFYAYQGIQLSKLKSIIRGIYSSTTAMCDPASPGDQSEETYEYDAQNRLVKVSRQKSYTTYTYNSRGYVEKMVLYGGTTPLTATFKYDTKGNIIEATDYSGYVSQYEYDDKINPYYLIAQKPSWISAFNKSPNNVIKIIWAQGSHVRTFKYNAIGLPTQMQEGGQTYYFEYQ